MAQDIALPHFRTSVIDDVEIVIVRSKPGITISYNGPTVESNQLEAKTVHTIFFLISPKNNPTQHLRILAQIAKHADNPDFVSNWKDAQDNQELRELMLHHERFIVIEIHEHTTTQDLIGKKVIELGLPKGSLIAMIRRESEMKTPMADTLIELGDRLTIIGDPSNITKLGNTYVESLVN